MEKDLIYKNAETLESAARDSLHTANVQVFKIADLLIKIAFAVGGLAATRIVGDGGKTPLLYSRWGLIFLGISVIFGCIQMLVDRAYFRRQGRLHAKAADVWKWFGGNPEDAEAFTDAKKVMNELASVSKSSSETALYLQITFVILGVVFVLIDVFKA